MSHLGRETPQIRQFLDKFKVLGRLRQGVSRLDQLHYEDLRILAVLFMVVATSFAIMIASLTLLPDSAVAIVVFDRQSPVYPITVQNFLFLAFGIGIGEVFTRLYCARAAERQIESGLLDVAQSQHLTDAELEVLDDRVVTAGAQGNDLHLHRLIHRVVRQYQATGSVGDSQAVLDSSVEYFQHEIQLRYTVLKYLTWLLPTGGFIGTLIGISLALNGAGSLPQLDDPAALERWIENLTTDLGVAFYTTLVALFLAAILMFGSNIAMSKEQRALNRTGQHCLDHLLSRLSNKPS